MHARDGEDRAEAFLLGAGFEILERQAYIQATMWVDGAPQSYELVADFIVARGKETALVEVKTGDRAPDPTHIATRRQLLDYQHAFDVDSIYLFDAETDELMRIEFA
jgi:Holliday junction resolvase-like predicted endonuclease